jgi:hypothetical protein
MKPHPVYQDKRRDIMINLWYYKLPGAVYANGPIWAKSEKEVRKEIRESIGKDRVPYGTQIWKK